jgi:hypothetical protein
MKDKIEEENRQLMEESMDISQHIQAFRKDKFSNEIDEQKFKIEDQMRNKIKDERAKNYKEIDR